MILRISPEDKNEDHLSSQDIYVPIMMSIITTEIGGWFVIIDDHSIWGLPLNTMMVEKKMLCNYQ